MVNLIKIFLYALFFILPSLLSAQTCLGGISTQLIDNNNGSVIDSKTGLIWKKCSEGLNWNSTTNSCNGSSSHYSWQEALNQAKNVNTGAIGEALGYDSWRVPNIKELSSIADLNCFIPAINLNIFSDASSSYYTSSSPVAGSSGYRWGVYFRYGTVGKIDMASGYQLRLVR